MCCMLVFVSICRPSTHPAIPEIWNLPRSVLNGQICSENVAKLETMLLWVLSTHQHSVFFTCVKTLLVSDTSFLHAFLYLLGQLITPPGMVVSGRLIFYCWCFLFVPFLFVSFLFLFCPEISKLPRPIAVKLCHMIESMFSCIIHSQNLGYSPPPKKKIGNQNVQNLVHFQTTSDSSREYLWYGWRYPK